MKEGIISHCDGHNVKPLQVGKAHAGAGRELNRTLHNAEYMVDIKPSLPHMCTHTSRHKDKLTHNPIILNCLR